MMGMTPRIRRLVLATWPERTAKWDEHVWDTWSDQLARFTEIELERAVLHYARHGNEWPPTWGMIYQIAVPDRLHREEVIATRKTMEQQP